MKTLDASFFDIRYLDDLSRDTTFIHRIDPRIKVITTIAYIIAVVSFNKYAISAMIPFALYPIVLLSMGNIPTGSILRRVLIVSPFALFIGIFNPFLDTEPFVRLGLITVTGGWVSFLSIMLRFSLTVSAALILISVTGFNAICRALEKLWIPKIFVMQLMFLYRYIFVLGDEAIRMNRARLLRSFSDSTMTFGVFKNFIGYLLLRTLDRAQRIHMAMYCRGFNGTIRLINPLRIGAAGLFFAVIWIVLFIVMRIYNIPRLIGSLVMELMV